MKSIEDKLPKDELRRLYVDERKSPLEIGKILGISNNSVRRYLQRYGVSLRTISESMLNGKKLPSEEELRKLYVDDKKTTAEIGKIYGVGNCCIGRYLKKYGVPMRAASAIKLGGKKLPNEQELKKLYLNEKKSTVKIGKSFGVSAGTILRRLIIYDIKIRTARESGLMGKKMPSRGELDKLYIHEKKSTVEIGKIYGLSDFAIGNYLKQYGIQVRNLSDARLNGKRLPSEKELRTLYIHEGMKATDISRRYGLSLGTITKYLKKYGIPLRLPPGNGSNLDSILDELLEEEK